MKEKIPYFESIIENGFTEKIYEELLDRASHFIGDFETCKNTVENNIIRYYGEEYILKQLTKNIKSE